MESNLVKARSSIVWLLALGCAFGSVWWIEKESGKELIAHRQLQGKAQRGPELAFSADVAPIPAPRTLTDQEQAWARTAWKYFEDNTDAQTGLAGSVAGFSGATMWDTASSLMALIAAQDLGLIDKRGFDLRVAKALVSLERMPLYGKQLPNKSYDVHALTMTDYAGQASPAGVGWSVLDVGRLLVPLNILVWRHPVHTDAVRRVLARWDLQPLAQGGELMGMTTNAAGAPTAVQEGRVGYEQYAARALALVSADVDAAADWRRHLQLVDVDGVQVCADDRDPQHHGGALDAVVSEPYVLGGLEFGWTRYARECAWRLYRAQQQRFARTGVLTAVSEDHLDRAPYFAYNTVWSAGKPWATVTDRGADAAPLRSLSVKAAFGWHALLRTDYTARLVEKAATLNDPQKGWYAGLYEEGGQTNKALSANTNAVVLESLAYIAHGPLLNQRRP